MFSLHFRRGIGSLNTPRLGPTFPPAGDLAMLPRRTFALLVLALSTGLTLGQSGPQVYTVSPTGATPGSTVELTVAGANIKDAQSLLFANDKIKAELVGDTAVASADKDRRPGGGNRNMTTSATSAVKFKVTLPKDLPTGTIDLRVVTKGGLSNPRAFVISKQTEVEEKEPNNDLAQAQPITLETNVSGVISTPTDVDYVKFPAKAGQKLVAACLTSSIDSKLPADLTVATMDGAMIAVGRGYRGGDAVAEFTAPSDGEYVVRVASFAYVTGGADHFYRLTVTAKPWVDAVFPPLWPASGKGVTVYGKNLPGAQPDAAIAPTGGKLAEAITVSPAGKAPAKLDELRSEQSLAPPAGFVDGATLPLPSLDTAATPPLVLFPQGTVTVDAGNNDTPEKAQPIAVPGDVAGRIEKRGDRDWYSFKAKKGEPLSLELFAERLGSPVDAYFMLTNEQGRVITEQDEPAETMSPNQFYTRSEDPARYRFTPTEDGTYRVMVSTREASIQAGARDIYVLRVAPEAPDFRVVVMPYLMNYPEGTTVPRGGSFPLTVYVDRRDGFDGEVALKVTGLPKGVTCPPQVAGPQQSRVYLILTADKDAKDWAGFVSITGTAEIKGAKVEHAARPFTVVWPMPENQGRPPNIPMITRLDRAPGLAIAVRGDAQFALAPTSTSPIKVKAGEKAEIAMKLTRTPEAKEGVQVLPLTTFTAPQRGGGGNRAEQPLATIDAGKSDAKVSLDIPSSLPSGTYTFVFRAIVPDPASKGNQVRPPKVAYPSSPVTLEVTAAPMTKGRR